MSAKAPTGAAGAMPAIPATAAASAPAEQPAQAEGATTATAGAGDQLPRAQSSLPQVNAPFELSLADSLYVSATVISIATTGLGLLAWWGLGQYGIVWREEMMEIFDTFQSFVVLYFVLSLATMVTMIVGLTKPIDERIKYNNITRRLRVLEFSFAIIAVVTWAVVTEYFSFVVFPSLIIALVGIIVLLVLQTMGHNLTAKASTDPRGRYFAPLSFQTSTLKDLFLSGAVFSALGFVFSIGGLAFFSNVGLGYTQYNSIAGLAFIYFLLAAVAAVCSVLVLVPGQQIETLSIVSWTFNLFAWIFALIVWALAASIGAGYILVYFVVAWILSLVAFSLTLAGWVLVTKRTGANCCVCDCNAIDVELDRGRKSVEIEKIRLEMVKLQKERENLGMTQV